MRESDGRPVTPEASLAAAVTATIENPGAPGKQENFAHRKKGYLAAVNTQAPSNAATDALPVTAGLCDTRGQQNRETTVL